MKWITTSLLGPMCAGFLVFVGIGTANSQNAQEIARKAFRSTVLLVMQDEYGQPLSLGSGFFVGSEQIASNLHVVEGAVRGYAKLVGQKTKYDLEGITAVDSRRDLVVLKIPVADSPVLPLGDSDAVEVGEAVYAVGNPQGLEGTFSHGIVSSIREVGTDRLLQITAPISPGSSGGPVLNGKGEVIGVSVATFRGGQNLNFAIPSKYLNQLLEEVGATKPLEQAKPNKVKGSILSGLGGNSSEGVTGTQLIWEYAGVPFGDFSFTLRNHLNRSVKNVNAMIVFYDQEETPLDFSVIKHYGLIPTGLAKRVSGKTEGSVQKFTSPEGTAKPSTRVEIRILGFEISD